ncbi:SDR family NAD(P)-dependent oxidoreductase [Schleiferilactobacillus perolens]|jgi:short-subunit dehydrogenase|uniref:SDR family NAD(P)-dependent oxidoreductase n=1 Tax=Schleiferilactobacillus perolens TaxID=100468 RepID=UPI002352B4ED|nr:SDR family NAD(P)-dependent oxidoreductase [Schleiferilactobacillus perolens]MCI2171241.1 SDR family NAD(P)-dependent oxidoreductase [Schleiferilactobacillus perolens]
MQASHEQSLTNSVVAITGASSGIGEAVAYEAARRGATLILMARSADKLTALAQDVTLLSGAPAYVVPVDVGDRAAIDDAVEQINTLTGRVDILLNAAGFGDFESIVDTDWAVVEKLFKVDVLGLMYFSRKIASLMMIQGHGHILNVGSMAGKMPTPKSAYYSAAKAAVIQFTNVLRLELKPFGILATSINPGPVATNFFNIADKSGQYLNKVAAFTIDPGTLATKIVNAMGTTKREINAPFIMAVASVLYPLAPRIGDVIASTFGNQK